MYTVDEVLTIETSKYSILFKRIFSERAYCTDVLISIDGQQYADADIESLLATWCTNSTIRSTHNFQLSRAGQALFGFHDGPSELWAASSERPFLQQLRNEGLIRYETATVASGRSSVIERLLHSIRNVLK